MKVARDIGPNHCQCKSRVGYLDTRVRIKLRTLGVCLVYCPSFKQSVDSVIGHRYEWTCIIRVSMEHLWGVDGCAGNESVGSLEPAVSMVLQSTMKL